MVNLTIDNINVSVPEGTTIIALFAEIDAHQHHGQQVDRNGGDDNDLCAF